MNITKPLKEYVIDPLKGKIIQFMDPNREINDQRISKRIEHTDQALCEITNVLKKEFKMHQISRQSLHNKYNKIFNDLQVYHQIRTGQLNREYISELNTLRSKYLKHQNKTRKCNVEYQQQIYNLKSTIKELKTKSKKEMEENKKAFKDLQELVITKDEHRRIISELQANHKNELQVLSKMHHSEIDKLEKKHEREVNEWKKPCKQLEHQRDQLNQDLNNEEKECEKLQDELSALSIKYQHVLKAFVAAKDGLKKYESNTMKLVANCNENVDKSVIRLDRLKIKLKKLREHQHETDSMVQSEREKLKKDNESKMDAMKFKYQHKIKILKQECQEKIKKVKDDSEAIEDAQNERIRTLAHQVEEHENASGLTLIKRGAKKMLNLTEDTKQRESEELNISFLTGILDTVESPDHSDNEQLNHYIQEDMSIVYDK